MRIKKAIQKMDNRKIAVGAACLFLLSMLPIWYLARYARPSGDDYGYSVYTHAAWLETHSLIAVFRAGIQTVKQYYTYWNGDWFTTFLFSLMPEVFRPWTFWIVPFIMTGALILGTGVLLYEMCVSIAGMKKEDFVILSCLILTASFQYIPSTAIGMYWYVGATHYIIPHMAALLTLVFSWRFFKGKRWRYLLAASLGAFVVGGSSYFSSLLLFMLLLVLIALGTPRNKKALWLFLPFLICLAGFVIQCKSPGNVARGGESFGFHMDWALQTILESLRQSVVTVGVWMREKTMVFILLLLFGAFSWDALLGVQRAFHFRFPLLFLALMYGCYSAQFSPAIYAAVDVSLGPATMEYLTFLLTAAASVVYVEGWAIDKLREKGKAVGAGGKYRMCFLFPVLGICLVLTCLNPGWIGKSVDRRAIEYVVSGQAEDFREQIASQMEILLDDSIKEAYLVPINNEQGPLMHMPVTSDEEAFTNRVVRDFYQKDRVVVITE